MRKQRKTQKKIVCFILFALVLIKPIQTNASELYYEYCTEIGSKYGIAPELLQAIVFVESRGDSSCVSNAGAVGVCQIIPRWHSDRMEKLGVTDLEDSYSNILVCADFINELHGIYGDNLFAVLNYYNSGNPSNEPTSYALNVTEKAYELEEINGKHNY